MQDDAYTIIKYSLFIICGIVIAVFVIPAGINAYNATHQSITDASKIVCNIDQTVMDSIMNATSNEMQNSRVKEIVTEIKNTDQIQSCQMKELFSFLTDDEKKKINVKETWCDVVNCFT